MTALLLSSTAVQAQSAVETVAYIMLGIENPARDKDATVEVGKNLIFEKYRVNEKYDAQRRDVGVERISDCKYNLRGQHYNSSFIIDVDFSSMSLDGISLEREQYGSRIRIPGAKVCAEVNTRNETLDISPKPGQCDIVKTRRMFSQSQIDRTVAAIKYLKSTYCKGSAF